MLIYNLYILIAQPQPRVQEPRNYNFSNKQNCIYQKATILGL